MVSTSVKTPDEVFRVPPTLLPGSVTLEHYAAVLGLDYLRFFWNSLIVASGTTALTLFFGILPPTASPVCGSGDENRS